MHQFQQKHPIKLRRQFDEVSVITTVPFVRDQVPISVMAAKAATHDNGQQDVC
jgi:hypothetical protein